MRCPAAQPYTGYKPGLHSSNASDGVLDILYDSAHGIPYVRGCFTYENGQEGHQIVLLDKTSPNLCAPGPPGMPTSWFVIHEAICGSVERLMAPAFNEGSCGAVSPPFKPTQVRLEFCRDRQRKG